MQVSEQPDKGSSASFLLMKKAAISPMASSQKFLQHENMVTRFGDSNVRTAAFKRRRVSRKEDTGWSWAPELIPPVSGGVESGVTRPEPT